MAFFYIATSLSRTADHHIVREALFAEGHQITYDWTAHGDSPKYISTQLLRDIAVTEVDAVLKADVLIVLLPGGGGTHVEMGVALAAQKPIIIHSEQEDPFLLGKQTKSFYHHPLVTQVVTPLNQVQPIVKAVRRQIPSMTLG